MPNWLGNAAPAHRCGRADSGRPRPADTNAGQTWPAPHRQRSGPVASDVGGLLSSRSLRPQSGQCGFHSIVCPPGSRPPPRAAVTASRSLDKTRHTSARSSPGNHCIEFERDVGCRRPQNTVGYTAVAVPARPPREPPPWPVSPAGQPDEQHPRSRRHTRRKFSVTDARGRRLQSLTVTADVPCPAVVDSPIRFRGSPVQREVRQPDR
jgi:hypothetical protein